MVLSFKRTSDRSFASMRKYFIETSRGQLSVLNSNDSMPYDPCDTLLLCQMNLGMHNRSSAIVCSVTLSDLAAPKERILPGEHAHHEPSALIFGACLRRRISARH
jgi:hypothetical protein